MVVDSDRYSIEDHLLIYGKSNIFIPVKEIVF